MRQLKIYKSAATLFNKAYRRIYYKILGPTFILVL